MGSDDRMRVPVLVAGGGPVGLTVAMDLAKRGIAVTVLEARTSIPPNPRCNTTNARSMEIFARLGCADEVRSAGLPADHSTDVVYLTELAGPELTRFRRPTPADLAAGTASGIGADWPTPQPQHFVSQLHLEPVLRRHAERLGVDLRLGFRLVSIERRADGVTAVAEDTATGRRTTIEAEWLVGADGSSSVVRHAIGASLEGVPAIERTVSVFFRSERVDELAARSPAWMYRFVERGVLVAISPHEWLLHVQVPPGEDAEAFDWRPGLQRAIGEPVEVDVIGVSRWTARAMVANKYAEGRVVLAGDAAHVWIPFGGFGMNAGIGDADALGWRLAGVLQGWLDPAVLDSYESERSRLGRQVAEQAPRWRAALVEVMQEGARTVDALREPGNTALRAAYGERIQRANRSEFENVGLQLGATYAGSPIVVADGEAPPPFELERYVESSVPGVRAPLIPRAGGGSLLDDLGPGFTLLRIGPTPPTGRPLVDEAALIGLPLAVVDVPEGAAVRAYGPFGLVLVRPDGYVAWRSTAEPEDPARILAIVTGRAAGAPEPPVHVAVVVADVRGEVRELAPVTVAASTERLYVLDPSGAVSQTRITGARAAGSPYPFLPAAEDRPWSIAADGSGVWLSVPSRDRVDRYDRAGRLRERVVTPAGLRSAAVLQDLLVIRGSVGSEPWLAVHHLVP